MRMIRLVCIPLALLALAGPAAARAAPDRAAELRAAQAQLARIAREVEQRGAARDAARSALAQADREMAAAARELAAREAALAREEAALQALEARVAEQARRLRDERHALAATLRARYETRHGGPLALLLGATDAGRSARLLAWQRYLAQAQAARLEALGRALEALAAERSRLAERHAQARSARARQADAAAALERTRAARRQALAQAGEALADARARERAQRADAQRLQALLERVARERARSPQLGRALAPPRFVASESPFASRRGKLPWPVPGRLAARFGQARESGQTRWQGALIATPPGTPVRAVHGGRVVYADALRGFGLLVIVDHGGGYLSLYGYNAALHRAAGDAVRPGDVLADVGAGLTSPDGLYFEIRANGRPVDPARWCRG